jgi:predicted O-methyltransferase YrrM
MLQNILPPDGTIFCVDTFEGGVEHEHLDMSYTFDRFMHNIAETQVSTQNVHVKRSDSFEALLDLYSDNEDFDFIYIDGSHETVDVMQDSVLAWKMLKEGGVLLWDDYRGGAGVGVAVDAFLKVYQHQLEMVLENYQLAVRKVKA